MNPRRKPCAHNLIAKGFANDDEVSELSFSPSTPTNDYKNEKSAELLTRRLVGFQHSEFQPLGWTAPLSLHRDEAILQWGASG